MKIIILKERCPAIQNMCQPMVVCPQNALSYIADSTEMKGGRIEINNVKCNECGICIPLCCGDAIEFKQI